ncbi:MAG: hypothetical protein N3A61_05445 [Ignavibacteria bacterium]|nr:hypothetical protein [Ignavibacteria bacterium]
MSKILSFQKERSLAIVELASAEQNTFNYISGPSAIKRNLIQVKEIDEGGRVNDILVENLSTEFVFFTDGDVLVGAKQNRVLNTSVLLAPNSKTKIPVSCVEQGRWSYRSKVFRETDYTIPTSMRASKAEDVRRNLLSDSAPYADQYKVWSQTILFAKSYDAESSTSDLGAVYEKEASNFDKFVNSFKCSERANGLAIFLKHSLLSIDLFNRTDIYAEYFPRILKGAAMDAFALKDDSSPLKQAEAEYKTLAFLDKFDEINFETYPAVGVGTEKRFETNELTGFELIYEKHMIHLSALNYEKANKDFSRRF